MQEWDWVKVDDGTFMPSFSQITRKADRDAREKEEEEQEDGQEHDGTGMDDPSQQREDEPDVIDDINPRIGDEYFFVDDFVNGDDVLLVQEMYIDPNHPTLYIELDESLIFHWNPDRECWEDDYQQPPPESKRFITKVEHEERMRERNRVY